MMKEDAYRTGLKSATVAKGVLEKNPDACIMAFIFKPIETPQQTLPHMHRR